MSKNLFGGQITEQDAVKEMMRVVKVTQKQVAEKLKRSPQSINRSLNHYNEDGMRVGILCKILDAMGCEMIIRPRQRRAGHLDEWKIR